MDEHRNEVFGIEGGVDEVGVASVTVPYMAESIEECFSVALGRIVAGLPEKSRTFAAYQGKLFVVRVLYEGQDGTLPQIKYQYSLRSNFEEEAIEAHPQILELMKKYNGSMKDGRVVFEPTYQEALGNFGLAKSDREEKKNPMCGVEKYKKLGVIWQRTYAASGLPGNILTRVGRTIDSPPGAPPELRGRSKWLVMPPSSNQRGNVVEITEEYMLLDEDEADGLYKRAGN